MIKIIILGLFSIFLVAGAAFTYAQEAQKAALPNPGLVPGNPFYFLDRIGETVREFFTFNPEGKARLQINFAAERIAEIKIILETKGVSAPGLDVAQSRLTAHFAKAASIVESEKSKGKDVRELAKSLNVDFDSNRDVLKQSFKEKREAIKLEIKDLKEEIKLARKIGDSQQLEALLSELDGLKAQKELLGRKEHDQEHALEEEEERLEKEIEEKLKAEEAIKEAGEEKEEIINEVKEDGLMTLPLEAFAAFEEHFSEAQAAFNAGNFESAEHHAKEAKESLEKIKEAIEELSEAKELEEELEGERGERGRGTKKEENGEIEKQIQEEAKRLEKETEKAAEAVRKAEERLREAGRVVEETEEEEEHQ
ncbi:MAG: hypothetical protein HYW34_03095 [Candidatus Brennerbacteria bacterium]|nr:hypothetical protein [Candidatus Brennerbacteria bacterium]